jgi:sec-independent protein translocase protein TatA
MGSMSLMHWVVVLILFMLLFGAGRVADMGKGLGEGLRNFKKGLQGDEDGPARQSPSRVAEIPPPHAKVIQVVVGEGEDEAQALQRVAAEKAAGKEKV